MTFVWAVSSITGCAESPEPSYVQDATVEWLEVRCGGERCLVMNAYRSGAGGFETDGADLLDPAEIASLSLRLPVSSVPDPSVLGPFLNVLGVSSLSALSERAYKPASLASPPTDFAVWKSFVADIRAGHELQIGFGQVRSVEVGSDLKRVYETRGYLAGEHPQFPHLVRGVLAVSTEHGDLPGTAGVLKMGVLKRGAPLEAVLRFVNLGTRPLRVYSSHGLLAGTRLAFEEFSLAPGRQASREVRYEATPISLLTGRSSPAVAYESEGERFIVMRVQGAGALSIPGIVVSGAREQLERHVGYWRRIPLYRIAVILIGLGSTILLGFAAIRAVPSMVSVAARIVFRLKNATRRMGRLGRSGAEQARTGAGWLWSHVRPGNLVPALQHRRMPLLPSTHLDLGMLAGPWIHRTSESFTSLAGNAAAFAESRLPVTWSGEARNGEPMSMQECVEHIRSLSIALRGDDSGESVQIHSIALRREAVRLARRIDVELRSGRMPPTVENFQIRWALRLLGRALGRRPTDPHRVVVQWLRGAGKVMKDGARLGVGPTNSEFMGLM